MNHRLENPSNPNQEMDRLRRYLTQFKSNNGDEESQLSGHTKRINNMSIKVYFHLIREQFPELQESGFKIPFIPIICNWEEQGTPSASPDFFDRLIFAKKFATLIQETTIKEPTTHIPETKSENLENTQNSILEDLNKDGAGSVLYALEGCRSLLEAPFGDSGKVKADITTTLQPSPHALSPQHPSSHHGQSQ